MEPQIFKCPIWDTDGKATQVNDGFVREFTKWATGPGYTAELRGERGGMVGTGRPEPLSSGQ